MTRRVKLPQSRRHIWVYDTDWEWLDRWYGSGAPPEARIFPGPAIREIVHRAVTRAKSAQAAALDNQRSPSDD